MLLKTAKKSVSQNKRRNIQCLPTTYSYHKQKLRSNNNYRYYSSGVSDTLLALSTTNVVGSLSTIMITGTVAYLASRYSVANAGEYLVKTGIFIKDIDISKQCFWLPFQTMAKIKMEPITYHCVIEEAMSHERISFNMPTVFTIGPKDDTEALKRYARLLQQSSPDDLRAKIIGIIQGETRMATGKLPLDDLFNNREKFKEHIVDKINTQLTDFGLFCFNCNIEELRDMKGNEYFVFLRKRALEGAVNKAKVDVAEQNKIGNIGESLHVTETRQKLAEFEKMAKLTENARDRDIVESNTTLSVAKAEFCRQVQIADYEAKAASEKRQLELQKEVEVLRNLQTLEQFRAKDFTAATVLAEVQVRKAEGVATSKVKESEGMATSVKLEAQGKSDAIKLEAIAKSEALKLEGEARAFITKVQAEADAKATEMKALADYIAKENEAKAILKLREAEAEGLSKLIECAGGIDNLNNYLMVRDKMITEIADKQSQAVRDMKPNITIWQNGQKDSSSSLSDVVQDIVTTAVPLVNAVKKSTGIDFLQSYRKNL